MNNDFFVRQLERLADAFGVATESERWNRRARIYYEALSYIDDMTFGQTVDDIIAKEDRFPTISQLIEHKQLFTQYKNFIIETCYACNSSGLVYALKDNYRFVFRCPECRNWENRFEGIPIWEKKYKALYSLDLNDYGTWDYNQPHLVKGLAVLGEGSMAWAKSPYSLQLKAKELIDSNWKPTTSLLETISRKPVLDTEPIANDIKSLLEGF